jgi:ParB family chromosome partitioning protein
METTLNDKPTTAKVTTARAQAQPPVPGTRRLFRLGDLVATSMNVRTTPRTEQDVRAIAQSIVFHGGVLQNLVLVPQLDAEGRWSGKLGVVAGETRRLALCLLRDGGIPEAEGYTDDYLVPGTVVAAPEGRAASLTENAIRTQLSPADQFEAFKALVDDGGDIEQIAAMYGVTPAVVERRLRLANASPVLFKLYREGAIELEQLMALCVTEDHALQERAWKSAPSWQRSAHHLRYLVTKDHVSLQNDPVARFVGATDYEAAGGTVVRDLFSEDGEGFIADKVLLQRLAQDKLEAVAAKVRSEGWAWVETRTQFAGAEQASYARCALTRKKLGAEDAKVVQALTADLKALQERIRKGDDSASVREQCEMLQAQIHAVEGSRHGVAEVSRPFAGAVVCIDRSGHVEVQRGLVKPEDVKADAKAVKQAEKQREADKAKAQADAETDGDATAEGAAPARVPDDDDAPSAGISRPLSLRLGAERTAALQLLLARNTSLALAYLAHTLVSDVLGTHYPLGYDPLQISARSMRGESLLRGDGSVQESPAYKQLAEVVEAWQARMPEDDGALLGWLMALPVAELCDLIAVCVACSTTTVPPQSIEARAMCGHEVAIAKAAGLDMKAWWEPTERTYLAGVSKAQVIALVRDVAGAEACTGLDKLPKKDVVAKAETLLHGKGWLHPLLQLPADEAEQASAD